MLRVFNCGLGMLLVVPREQCEEIRERLEALGERCYRVGEIEAKTGDEPAVLMAPLRPS
jgi:phosphoribosylformylglycinamidine cyclo-ligase